MNSGRYSSHSFPNQFDAKTAKAVPDESPEKCLTASVGFYERAHNGLIYLNVIRRTKRVIGAFKNGRETAYFKGFWRP